MEDATLPKPGLAGGAKELNTFSVLLDRNDMPRDGLRVTSLFGSFGLGGEGERFLALSRRDWAKLGRKVGSRRGGDMMEVREVFFLSRRGDGGCVGVTIACGETTSSPSMLFSRLKRDSSE